jgi:hypothetical protein
VDAGASTQHQTDDVSSAHVQLLREHRYDAARDVTVGQPAVYHFRNLTSWRCFDRALKANSRPLAENISIGLHRDLPAAFFQWIRGRVWVSAWIEVIADRAIVREVMAPQMVTVSGVQITRIRNPRMLTYMRPANATASSHTDARFSAANGQIGHARRTAGAPQPILVTTCG